jgi:hypothetical protein
MISGLQFQSLNHARGRAIDRRLLVAELAGLEQD